MGLLHCYNIYFINVKCIYIYIYIYKLFSNKMTDFLCFDLIEVFVRTKQNILIVLHYLIII